MTKVISDILISTAIAIGGAILGITMIAFSQVMLAIRETALNTRKQEKLGEYKTLEVLAVLNSVIGWIIIVGAIVFEAYAFLMAIRS